MWLRYAFIVVIILFKFCDGAEEGNETDSDTSRKILGSSVVTSVSVVMDTGNGKKTLYTDAVGKPQTKPSNPSELASPIDLLNPDRYEFYTFDDNGDLVKRLMSLEEIKSIIATGDSDALDLDSFTSQGFLPEKRVSDVVSNVQTVLKEEMEILKDPISKPIFDTPDVSDSWSMILPAIFGNSGEDIKPEKPIAHITPDTIMLEPNMQVFQTTPSPQKVDIILSSSTTIKNRPNSPSTHRPTFSTTSSTYAQPIYYSSQALSTTQKLSSTTEPSINVEIFSNSMSTTDTNPVKESLADDEEPLGKNEPLPTRAPALNITRAPLVRNTTNINYLNATSTTVASSAQALTEEMYSDTTTSFSSKPTTIKSTSIGNDELTQNEKDDLNATTSLVTDIIYKTTPGSSSTPVSPVSSSHTATSFASTSSSSKAPLLTSTSKLTVKPQLAVSNIFINSFSTTSSISNSPSDITTTHLTSTVPISVITNSERINGPDLITEGSLTMISTQTPKETMPSSIEILNTQHNWTPSNKDSELFNIFKETIAKGATTEYVKDDSTIIINKVEEYDIETTTIKDVITQNKIQSNNYSDSSNEDLSTLPTEYLHHEVPNSSNQYNKPTTILPPLLHSLSDKQKLSASELLDQLLLTTNIYEINTELASTKLNISDMDVRFASTASNQQPSSDQVSDKQTTADHDVISYPPTTDITLMQSIEQLLSQAVGDIQVTVNQTLESPKIKEILENSAKKNMTDLIKESATAASEITIDQTELETTQEFIHSTEKNQPDSTVTNNNNLNSSVEALLSQVYDDTSSLNKVAITEKPFIGITYRKVDGNDGVTTQRYVTNVETFNETINENTTQNLLEKSTNEHKKPEQETTTYYFIVTKELNNASVKNESPYLINMTQVDLNPIINRTKPAKADLSLEQALIAEEMKNISLLVNNTQKNPLQLNDTLKQSETKIILINSTFNNKERSNVSEESIFTTISSTNEGDITTSRQFLPTEEYISTALEIDTTTTNLLLTESSMSEVTTIKNNIKENISPATTSGYTQKLQKPLKPSIIITINENNTVVTENGKLVSNKTLNLPEDKKQLKKENNTSTALKFIEKNSTQDQTWTLVSTVAPQHLSSQGVPPLTISYQEVLNPPAHVDLVPKPMQGFGLEESTANLNTDVYQFAQLCNELAFGFWKTSTSGLSSARSVFVSPFAAISMLAMVFLGAKGATSEEMNEILKLDDMVTFNPHLIFKNVTESINSEPYSGVAVTAMIRELFSDRSKGKLLDFYKSRVKAFYDGYVEEVGYREIGDVIRRRTNLLIKKYTNGKYSEFLRDSSITARPPLSGVSVNIFETDCSQTSTEGRDGELHFIILPSMRQRRLVPIPAVVYKSGFLAGYEPSLDATAVSVGTKEQTISSILVIPGQQGIAALGDGLARLEKRLVESSFKKGAWSRLLRSLIPRPGLEVQIPRFSHRSIINATNTLQRMGLHELFNPDSADLRGLNGAANELHLSDVLQINSFMTCGEKRVDGTHHSEVYPAATLRARGARYLHQIPAFDLEAEPRDYQRAFHDPLHDPSLLALPLSLRPRQARIPETPRLRFDRPFLYFIRHNPTGLILHMGNHKHGFLFGIDQTLSLHTNAVTQKICCIVTSPMQSFNCIFPVIVTAVLRMLQYYNEVDRVITS